MFLSDSCRVCLSNDRDTYCISNTALQVVWERLTNAKFDVDDGRPLVACYICCTHLRKSNELLLRALKAEEMFTAYINSDLKESKELLKLLPYGRQTYKINYNYDIKKQYNLECVENEIIRELEQTDDTKRELEGNLFFYKEGDNDSDLKEHEYQTFGTGDNIKVEVELLEADYDIAKENRSIVSSNDTSEEISDENSDNESNTKEKKRFVDDERSMFIEIELEENEIEENEDEDLYITEAVEIREGVNEDAENSLNVNHENEGTFKKHKLNKSLQTGNRSNMEIIVENKPLINSAFKNLSSVKTDMKSTNTITTYSDRSFEKNKFINFKQKGPENKVLCPICLKSFTEIVINKHIRAHSEEKTYVCKVCNYTCTKISNLKRHMQHKHKKDKNFLCHMCPYKCVTKFLLEKHLRKHYGDKPYVCFICDYSSTDKKGLKKHMLCKHTNGKKFSCPLCEYKTITRANLNIHLRKHTGQNLCVCKMCDYKCLAERDLKRHMQYKHIKEKNLSCPVCEYKCVEKSNMLRHIRTHTGEKPYGCMLCDYRSKDPSTLNKHMKVKHSK